MADGRAVYLGDLALRSAEMTFEDWNKGRCGYATVEALARAAFKAGQHTAGDRLAETHVVCGELARENAYLRVENERLKHNAVGAVRHWQGEGKHFPDTLSGPVVVESDVLREILNTITCLEARLARWIDSSALEEK